MPTRRALLIALGAGAATSGCSSVSVLNAVVTSDDGAVRAGRDIAYGSHPRQRLDIYRPRAAARPVPVVVFIYGGSWNSGSKDDYGFAAAAFAGNGHVSVVPDYRLVPEVRFPSFLDDCAAALAWVRNNIAAYGGDPHTIFVAGHSAGAYNAVMVALDPRFLARAGLRPGFLKGVAGLSGPYDFLPLDTRTTLETFSFSPRLEETQPVNFVRRGLPPFFLATGAEDDLVFPRNTRALAKKLRGAAVPTEEKVYPGLGHSGTLLALSVTFRERAPVLPDMLAFFRRCTA